MLKQKPIVSQKIRNAAKGEECTLNIVGVCNYDPSTVVLCHLPDESHGMAKKSDDISACFGCSDCHDAIDGRIKGIHPDDKEFYFRRAQTRTWRRLIELGVIKIG